MYTGQLLATPVLIAAWIAAVSSCAPSPSAPPALPGQRTSSQGWPEHINTSPLRVAAPVVVRVEKLPGDCACTGAKVGSQMAASRVTALIVTELILIPVS